MRIGTLMAALLTLAGCSQPVSTPESPGSWKPVAKDELSEKQLDQLDRALSARQALFESLKGRLTEVVGSDGPVAAIEVCSREAPQIAQRVSKEHGLSIGRTSFKLRNQANQSPKWARSLVDRRVEEPHYLVLLPIKLEAQCVVCHGPRESLAEPVLKAIAANYPADQATGFQPGDLRGWFWVEVTDWLASRTAVCFRYLLVGGDLKSGGG